MRILVVVPARGGSKGIPGKNTKDLGGKPLLAHTLTVAGKIPGEVTVCVSTDDAAIAAVAAAWGYPVPFLRPAELATDTSGTYEVLLHALNHYRDSGYEFDALILLQPTSPFRRLHHVTEALGLYRQKRPEMVVSVKPAPANPYYDLFEEADGRLVRSKTGNFVRRQDCPAVYQFNGSVYIIRVAALRKRSLGEFEDVVKYVMEAELSVDLDEPNDWRLAEWMLAENPDLVEGDFSE